LPFLIPPYKKPKAAANISRLNLMQLNKELKMTTKTKSIIYCTILLLSFYSFSQAQQKGFGAGMILGEPTGISLKKWLGYSKAMDFAIAWSFEGNNSLTLHADYLNHNFKLISVDRGKLPFYYGFGGRIKFNDKNNKNETQTRLGVRVPVGLAYLFENITLDLFAEIVPILELVPETEFILNAAVGIRFFFD
jgi:hypothetical protein